MSEFVTADDMQYRSLSLMKSLAARLKIRIGDNNKAYIDWDRNDVNFLSAELLEIYTLGVNEWIAGHGRKSR